MGDGSSSGSMFKEVKEAAIVIGVLIGFAVVVGFLSLIDYQRKSNTSYDYAASILLQQASTQQCDAFLYNLTRTPTVAGENLETAKWIQSQMIKFGLTDSRIDQYDVMLSTPTNLNQIQLLDVDNNVERDLDLYEKPIDEDPTSKIAKEKIPTYNAYSASGECTQELVYVNYGRKEDFDLITKEYKVDLTGKIVLVKYGKNFRGVKAMLAEQHGACGLIIYSDPANDGSTLGEVFPKGAWRPEDAVQRGSAQFLQIAPGDPLTPGFPSIPEYASKRGKYSDAKNVAQKIIIQPISYKNAKYLLDSMNGQAAPSDWRGGIDTTYRLTGSTRVYMKIQMENKIKPIYNVITTIKGAVEPDRNVILGNHYDAWIYGGVDPHTATSSLLELSRLFGKLVQENWRPPRTIVIANWDAEEFGLIGSTEHCERYAETLVSQTIAYINIDSFTGREYFDIGASPNLAQVAREESKKVKVSANQTAFELWQKTRPGKNVDIPLYSSLGSGSDYTGFLQYLGISSMEINSDGKYGVYHSVFDSYEYVKRIVDPTFEVCKYTAQIWGLIVLRFASDSILPINNIEYVEFVTTKYQEMRKSVNTLSLAGKFDPSQMSNLNHYWSYLEADMQAASDAVVDFYNTKPITDLEKRQFNDKLMRAERAFIDQQGLAGREWYKHLLFAPGLYLGYGGEVLPGIQTAITHGDYYRIIIEIDRVRLAFSRFVDILNQ